MDSGLLCQPQTPQGLAPGSRPHISSSQDPRQTFIAIFFHIIALCLFRSYLIPDIISLSFSSSGYIARYAPPAILKRRHWQHRAAYQIRKDQSSAQPATYQPPILPYTKLYHYLELNSTSVLPNHRTNPTSPSAPTSSYLRALLNTAALPDPLRTESSAPTPYLPH